MQTWLNYFEHNRRNRPPVPWDNGVHVEPHLRAPLIRSLQKFPLGESGEGRNLKRHARAALEPQFIAQVPRDVIGGGPLKYRREANGTFTLYSIGWNERDDGGVAVFKKGSTPDLDVTQGDWVWRYPVKD